VRTLRRAISIVFYLFAGAFLMTWACMSFVGSEPDLPKAGVMAFFAPFSLVPLALGLLISPGRRSREAGIVLIVAAGWVALAAVTLVITMADAELMATMPPETRLSFGMFSDPAFGAAFTVAMGAVGVWLVRRGNRPPVGTGGDAAGQRRT
jgi:ABC-type transport system involved in cytochrome c biogenesis permease subunit